MTLAEPHARRRRGVVATLLSAALAVPASIGLAVPAAAAPDGSGLVINEAYLSGGSANAPYRNKFVELYNPTDAAIELSGMSLQYRSATSTGAFGGVVALDGSVAPGGYYLVAGGSNGTTGQPLPTPDQSSGSLNPSGTTGTIALVRATSAVALPAGGGVNSDPRVVDLLGYGTSNTFETSVAPAPSANNVPASINRTDAVDTDDNGADFRVLQTVTPQTSTGGGQPDPEPTPEPTAEPTAPAEPGQDSHTIAEIQGTGAVSPLVGRTVTTTGVVTAAYPTGGLAGYTIQTPGTGGTTDATPGASDALFVYSPSTAGRVSVGDTVQVTGAVSEYYGLTQITVSSTAGLRVLPAGEPVTPLETAWPATDAEREALESMLVAPQGPFTVSNTYSTNQYGEVGLAAGEGPLVQGTEAGRPGSAEKAAVEADNAARGVVLDDGASVNFLTSANSSMTPSYVSLENPVRVGAPVTFTAPVIVDFRNDTWKLNPTGPLTAGTASPVTFENTRTRAPEPVGGDLKVGVFNVLNYFTTLGADWPGATSYKDRQGNPVTVNNAPNNGPRGAWDAASLARQQAKIVAAINDLDADVVGLLEIENSAALGEEADEALATLVDALNADAGSDVWAYVPSSADLPAASSQDVITNALIYKPAVVERVGDSRALGDQSRNGQAFANAREPIGQSFAPVEGGEPFFVAVNHFKSKGSAGPWPGDADKGDGQGSSNESRVRQATALRDWVATVTEPGEAVALVGDFNAYTHEDPMHVLYDAGYTDAATTFAPGKYSYSFSGLSGSLDHVLLNEAALARTTGADVWEINAEESIALEYSRYNYHGTLFYEDGPYRSSDHNPVVVGLTAGEDAGEPGPVRLDILNINDFHGRIDGNTVAFAGTVEELRAENPEGTLFVSAGDNIGASLFASAVADDQPTIDVLNALGMDASAVGNHEFDQGFEDLAGRVTDESDFPILGANVYLKGTTTAALPEYEVVSVQGVDVGFVGVVTPETPTLVSPAGVADLDFGDQVEAINRVTAQLKDGDPSNGEADVVIALVHDGASAGTPDGATLEEEVAAGGPFAELVTETDARVAAILTGHTHKQYAWDAPVPGVEGKTRPIVQTGNYGEFLGRTTLTVDPATGEVTDHESRNVARTTTATDVLVGTYPRVAEVKTIVDAALAHADEIGSQPVSEVTADITTAFAGGSYVDGVWTGGSRDDRASESTLGNLVGNALRDSLAAPERGGAQIGIVNPGGLRADLRVGEDGVITYAEANAVLPFVNNVWSLTVTGAQLEQILEEQWQTNADGTRPSRPYLALGLSDNVTWVARTADGNATPGDNVLAVYVDGQLVQPDDTFRVSTFSFLATGGDNFRTFAQATDVRDSGLVDRDAWIAYLRDNAPLSPSFARTRVVAGALPGTVRAGEQASAELSGLDLTSLGSPRNTTATVALVPADDTAAEGVSLGDVAVSNGTATIAATVPATTAAGQYALKVTASPSGTTALLPLTVEAAPAPPAGVTLTGLSARAQCVDGRAAVAVYAVNGEQVPVDIRLTTPYGDKKLEKVAPGKAAYAIFTTGAVAVPAGTAQVAGYYWDGVGHHQVYTVEYAAVECTPPVPAYSPTTIYTGGEKVTYQGKVYQAQWWTQGAAPGASPWGSWMEVGAEVKTSTGTFLRWTDSWVYTGGETVVHDGHLWKARWWTRNQAPGAELWGPWQDLGKI
ncbi:ExeM/NucH family extracellular endonuclease [Xylanimonas oleitrophica]|uniref:ExeM/NucH family extracellular endonuclease n=1 Tax=Xylanimonas oleitrophica TaxID=2607479 RepID=UPI001FEC6B9F|nr:ExeM/NucH family extracellular endonuclease [Xylanimonas oleitrophica]